MDRYRGTLTPTLSQGGEGVQSQGEAHGGIRLAELRQWGIAPEDVIDFSASVNPYGPSPQVRSVMRRVRLDRYPDIDCTALVEALSQHVTAPTEWIVPGNGASELIHAAARAWSGRGKLVGHCPPTFGEYAAAAEAVGATVVPVDVTADDLSESDVSLLYICNPNNPTGQLISFESIARIVEAMAPRVVVLDEAFIGFVAGSPTALPLLDDHPNLLIIRSMTKDYGLTALRLGYAVGQPSLVAALHRQLPPWSVNGVAQAAGVAALKDQRYLDVTLEKIQRAKDRLVRDLERDGWPVCAGHANFVLVNVGEGRDVRERLAQRGLLVRDCQSFGMPAYIRIAVRRPAENRRLVSALAEVRGTHYTRASENDVQ